MKRLIAILCVLCLIMCLWACQSDPATESTTEAPSTEPTVQAPATESTEPTQKEPPTTEPPSTEPPLPYKVIGNRVQVYQVSSGTIWALAIITVENTGSENLYLDYGTVTLTDKSGKQVGVMGSVSAYPQVIAPGEVGYYCDNIALDIANKDPLTATLDAQMLPTDKEALRYEFSDLSLTDTSFGGMLLEGNVTNNTDATGDLVCVCAILYDEAQYPIGFISGYLDGLLESGGSEYFAYESFMLPEGLKADFVHSYNLFGFPLEDAP